MMKISVSYNRTPLGTIMGFYYVSIICNLDFHHLWTQQQLVNHYKLAIPLTGQILDENSFSAVRWKWCTIMQNSLPVISQRCYLKLSCDITIFLRFPVLLTSFAFFKCIIMVPTCRLVHIIYEFITICIYSAVCTLQYDGRLGYSNDIIIEVV